MFAKTRVRGERQKDWGRWRHWLQPVETRRTRTRSAGFVFYGTRRASAGRDQYPPHANRYRRRTARPDTPSLTSLASLWSITEGPSGDPTKTRAHVNEGTNATGGAANEFRRARQIHSAREFSGISRHGPALRWLCAECLGAVTV